MFASLLRPNRSRRRRTSRSEPSYFARDSPLRNQPDARLLQHPDRQRPSDSYHDEEQEEDAEALLEESSGEDTGALEEVTPLLPIFSAAHLDALPLYDVTHSIRLLIVQRCETILTWEQLRSPQISQFLVKPIQQQILSSHWSRATIYALIANCLQFNKEGQTNPGSSGFCKTRAMLSEMLAMRLLREFSTTELIDVLSYDFDPLQGIPPPTARGTAGLQKRAFTFTDHRPAIVRTSAIEVAIRAQAKRFLAHPLVVQHLEAVWAGNIVFHSAADNLHRYPPKPLHHLARHYGATLNANGASYKPQAGMSGQMTRRAATLYNPADASVFKLSRLRVPRYRLIFSTLSYMIMLGLFLAILVERSLDITAIEVIFWFWSAGFMLDEIVGFSEQGFGLYIISVWNAFDVGILIMFFIYYVLRLYGIIIAANHKHYIADMAYDVLASTAVLLFPRLFNFLDHYKYFSQLLIAFRMMSQDLVAILILMAITCSGFFVAFTFSFGQQQFGGPAGVVYALFQIVMGFTPAAWAVWDQYNILGQTLLTVFMIICHFLVVTILITVLTNSFMAIVKAADEEHQFLFAVNTISLVKSDALFSYIAPTNLVGWVFSPLRYIMPFRQFVKINRTIIKITHFPILLLIFVYEKLRLARFAYEPTELIERHTRRNTLTPFALNGPPDVFSPGTRLREPSITAYHKDRALDEVFRRPFEGESPPNKTQQTETDGQSNVVDRWISGLGDEGGASPPEEQPRSILERLERHRPPMRRAMTSYTKRKPWRSASQSGSALSDPEDRFVQSIRRRPQPITEENEDLHLETQVTDRDADDELLTNAADDESVGPSTTGPPGQYDKENTRSIHEEDLVTPIAPRAEPTSLAGSISPQKRQQDSTQPNATSTTSASAGPLQRVGHQRNSSTTTILFNPQSESYESSSASPRKPPRSPPKPERPRTPGHTESFGNGRLSPRRTPNINTNVSRAAGTRPNLANRNAFKSTPNVARFLDLVARTDRRTPSFEALALDLASDIGDNRNVTLASENIGLPTLTGSFQEQLAQQAAKRFQQQQRRSEEDNANISRMMLARMNSLEEGFRDILREVRMIGSASSKATSAGEEGDDTGVGISPAAAASRIAGRRTTTVAGAANMGRVARGQGVSSLDGLEDGRTRSSGLREVETADHVVVKHGSSATTAKSTRASEIERSTAKTSISF